MSITKSITIHNDTKGVMKYIKNNEKTDLSKYNDTLTNEFDYTTNPEKTTGEKEILVTGVNCNSQTANTEFKIIRDKYYSNKKENLKEGQRPVLCYHMIQSFDNKLDLNPELVHQIGVELAESFEGYQCLVSTHLDKKHLHNHIVMNAYNMNGMEKFNSCKESYRRLRETSDKLSEKYGIPIIVNPEGHGMSHKEWSSINEGTSWKEQVRIDIKAAVEMSKTWKEYVQNLEDAGYTLTNRASYITYTTPTGSKVRDIKLGKEYERNALLKEFNEEILPTVLQNEEIKKEEHEKKNKVNLHVGRYTIEGRKRSELELILLLAIKAIKKLKDVFLKEDNDFKDNPIFKSSSWKIQNMIDTINVANEKGITTKQELLDNISNVGKELSIEKKYVNELTTVNDNLADIKTNIDIYNNLKNTVKSYNITDKDLYIKDYSEEEIIKNKKAIDPLTNKDKQQLWKLLTENQYFKLKGNFEDLNRSEAREIITFLKSENQDNKPAALITIEEQEELKKNKLFNKILLDTDTKKEEFYKDKPLSQIQEDNLNKISKEYNLIIPLTATNWDKIKILNFYENNDLTQLINDKEKAYLEKVLNLNPNLKLNKPIEHIYKYEYMEFINYAKIHKGNTPELLKGFEPAADKIKSYINDISKIKGVEINTNTLSKNNAYKVFEYLLYKDIKPSILNPVSEDDNILYETKIAHLDYDKQQTIDQYRNSYKELKSIGLNNENEMEKFQEVINSQEEELKKHNENVKELGKEYKELTRLKYNIDLAENPKFIYGSLFDETKNEIEIDDITEEKEEKEIQEQESKSKNKGFTQEDNYFTRINL